MRCHTPIALSVVSLSIAALVVGAGCKKDGTETPAEAPAAKPADTPAKSAKPSGTPLKVATPGTKPTTEKTAPETVAPKPGAADKKPNPAATTPDAPTPTPDAPVAKPSTPGTKPATPTQPAASPFGPNAPAKPLRMVCVRACNKMQMCGKANGSGAAECMQKCLDLGATDAPENKRAIESFRAQEACADKKCEELDACVQRQIAQRRQLAPVPAMEMEAAKTTCKELCEHEQKCRPEIFVQLRKNMEVCQRYCAAVLTGKDNASTAARTIMNEAIQCLGKSCEDFEKCMR